MMSASGAILGTSFFHAQLARIVSLKISMVSPMPMSWELGAAVYGGRSVSDSTGVTRIMYGEANYNVASCRTF